ncbi:LPS biosynthesis protein WbpP, partial [bacterium]|nr:LPS biosynthesis protein WbpP [bacterium]
SLASDLRAEHVETRAGDVRVSEASIERARTVLGYEPVVGFEEGLDRTCRWFREHPDRAKRSASA